MDLITGDMMAGINAGVFTIGFNEDQARTENMIKANPNRVVDKLIDIIEILKEDISWTKDMN